MWGLKIKGEEKKDRETWVDGRIFLTYQDKFELIDYGEDPEYFFDFSCEELNAIAHVSASKANNYIRKMVNQ